MTRRKPFECLAISVLVCATAGCFLDTAPLADSESTTTGPVLGDADAGSKQPTSSSTTSSVTASGSQLDAGVAAAAPASASATPVVQAATPAAAGGTKATAPAMAPSSAPAAQCDAIGSSYALHAEIDVMSAASAWADAGRGNAELYGIVRVDAVDPQTHVASARFRTCGLVLPTLTNAAFCSSYELQFPDATWDKGKPHEQAITGTYECDAASCSLRFAPASFVMGIQLPDANAAWPAIADTKPSQFPDDDGDGHPGVSVDVISLASARASQNGSCSAANGSTGPGPGPGTPVMPAAMREPVGKLLVGLRTQLTAALQLAPDCRLSKVAASDAAIELRSAGCFVMAGAQASPPADCTEEMRASYEAMLPSYDALKAGEVPSSSGSSSGSGSSSSGKKQPSIGTKLRVVGFAAGMDVSCAQARGVMF